MKWKFINFVETTKHKTWVAWYLLKACAALIRRAIVHDLSKYSKDEAPFFEVALPKLRNLEYGSDEYKTAILSLGPALKHHDRNNSHHPEYWNGVESKSPLDTIEMLCDWKAATRRHATGNFSKSLEVNEKRFNYPPWKTYTFKTAAKEIGLLKNN